MRRLFLTACMLLCLACGLCACKSDAVKTVERQISEIVVSENSGKAIAASRAAYDALTEDEKKEQALLRQEYVASIRKNLRSQLNNIDMVNEDGTIENLGEKYGNEEAN